MKYLLPLTVSLFLFFHAGAQHDSTAITGNWKGLLPDSTSLGMEVSLQPAGKGQYTLLVSRHKKVLLRKTFTPAGMYFTVPLGPYTTFRGKKGALTGFIQSGMLLYHLPFTKNKTGGISADWRPWMTARLNPSTIYLSIETNGQAYTAYPFFDDQRFSGTWAGDFSRSRDTLLFHDYKTGMSFRGLVQEETLQLDILLGNTSLGSAHLKRFNGNFPVPGVYPPSAPLQKGNHVMVSLSRMEDSIAGGKLVNTHSVLVAQHGKLIYEKYFSGFQADIPHDLRSASKSISSALIGMAISKGLLKGAQQKLYELLPEKYQYTMAGDARKENITLHSLLTMSSGIDAVDFGIERPSAASEDAYQNSSDWLKTVLEAPMIHDPGTHANYGSANPYLLGVALAKVIKEPLEFFIDQSLMQPLGIHNYMIQTDDKGHPYFGGGMYLQPQDLLKFGQLYLNKGRWHQQQLLTPEWVAASWKPWLMLENRTDSIAYGYLWWHHNYTVKNKKFHALEMRGAGGQYVFVIPALDLVVAITSGNYRNGKYAQPERILEDYILPACLGL